MQLREYAIAYRARLEFFIRYGVVGVLGGLLQIGVLFVWVSVLEFKEHYLWGVVIGFSLAVVVTFILQKYWTFRDHTHHMAPQQLVLYSTFSVINLGLNALLLHLSKSILEDLGLDFFHVWYLVAQIVVISIVAVLSFLSNRYVTFRSTPL
ncbi:GtrA family protein [Candidatus Kaiserbacteria bacterium]|nr:GtrA family protein [Candidatus Kaiserbacteria bacterium]